VSKNVVAQFIGQMRLMNQATTKILGVKILFSRQGSGIQSSSPSPGGRELEGGGLYIKRAFKDVVAQFIGQMRLMNQATTEIWG